MKRTQGFLFIFSALLLSSRAIFAQEHVISQAELFARISVFDPEALEMIKDQPVLGYRITSANLADLPEFLQGMLKHKGNLDKTFYPEKFLRENVGTMIIIQATADGKGDFYIPPKDVIATSYAIVEAEEVEAKNPKLLKKLRAIEGFEEFERESGSEMKGLLRKESTFMVRLSDIGFKPSEPAKIVAPWGGTQEKDVPGRDAFLAFDPAQTKSDGEPRAYIVQSEQSGNPVAYIERVEAPRYPREEGSPTRPKMVNVVVQSIKGMAGIDPKETRVDKMIVSELDQTAHAGKEKPEGTLLARVADAFKTLAREGAEGAKKMKR